MAFRNSDYVIFDKCIFDIGPGCTQVYFTLRRHLLTFYGSEGR